METLGDVIKRYARLSNVAELHTRLGLTPPPNVAIEMQEIESEARARIHPEHLQNYVLPRIAQARFEDNAERHLRTKAAQEQRFKKGMDKQASELTQGMLGLDKGLNAAQFAELRDTGKVTLPPNRVDPKRKDEIVRQATRGLDPTGRGYTEAEWVKRLDALTDAKDDKEFSKLASQYRADPMEIKRQAAAWKTDRITHGVMQRREADAPPPKPTVLEPSESDSRRMQIADAYLASSMKGEVTNEHFFNETPKALLEEDGLRGDVARAFENLSQADDA